MGQIFLTKDFADFFEKEGQQYPSILRAVWTLCEACVRTAANCALERQLRAADSFTGWQDFLKMWIYEKKLTAIT